MSLADLKLQVSLLPFEQRRELERYLVSLETDEEFNHLISSRMKAMDEGRKVPFEEFLAKAGIAADELE